MRLAVAAALAATVLLGATAAEASARPCAREKGFDCRVLDVPLDRAGATPGTISLRYAIQQHGGRGVLLALTGGPGQNGIAFGPTFAEELKKGLRGRRLLVLDQRGTGRSGALSCPEVQGLDGLQLALPETVASCASRLGPRRDHYATADTVEDIEAIRRQLGVARLAIFGVSYGTWVAQEYARRYPQRVERLVLDSVVAPGDDANDTRTLVAVQRLLRELCDGGGCETRRLQEALAAVLDRMRLRGGRLAGVVRDPFGGRRSVTLSEVDLLTAIVSTDLNPWLRAQLPAALVAAASGDQVPLLRLRRDVASSPIRLADLSAAVFVATTCADSKLPYALSAPYEERAAAVAAALAALPAAALGPFSRATVDAGSAPRICLGWPAPARPTSPVAAAPLPDVPTLILAGRDDLRTPLEGARALAATLPQAKLVVARGTGHDVLGSDDRNCGELAIRRFLTARPVGDPCRGGVERSLAPVPPRALDDVVGVAGVPGRRGSVLAAVVATIEDARASGNQALYAGVEDLSTGGLRGGYSQFALDVDSDLLLLHRNVYVPGVSVTGVVELRGRRAIGELRVGAGRRSGSLRFRRSGLVTGRLGGVPVRATVRLAR